MPIDPHALATLYNDQAGVRNISGKMNYGKAYAVRWIKMKHPTVTVEELAKSFDVSPTTITQILHHVAWKGDRTLTRMMFVLFESDLNIMEELK